MASIIAEEPSNERILKSYIDYSLNQFQETIAYSPTVNNLFDTALTQVQTWTPQLVQDTVLGGAVDGIDYMDELLVVGLEKCHTLKDKLTAEQITEIIEEIKSGADSQINNITDYLPSSYIEDFALKEQVDEIIAKILSKPQLMKDQAAGLAENVHTSLDKDQDGKVSVKDLADNVAEVSKNATDFVCTAYDSVSTKVLSSLKEVLATPSIEDYVMPIAGSSVEFVKSQWEQKTTVLNAFLPLWSAVEILKSYVHIYTSNIQSKFEPLSPYLMELLGNTSIIDIPLEIVQVLQSATGFVSDKERDSVVRETRALFWALIDISFLLQVLKQDKDVKMEAAAEHEGEGVKMVHNAGHSDSEGEDISI